MQQKYAIITAGGSGLRMNSSLPKQFLPLHGKPILFHTISVFLRFSPDIHIILVLPEEHRERWKSLCSKHHFHPPITLAHGGPTRFHSVKNGLKYIPEDALVAIHDGVRPLVSLRTIQQCFHIASKFGNAIPAVSINESVRLLEGAFSKVISRDSIRLIQTPQCFLASKIKAAYNVNYDPSFTDDATVLENNGERVYMVEGNKENIKITTPEELVIATSLMEYINKKED
ncbi:MAG: 2-C-methyl-D-erythritol 4-phosphate cytidylyltransferase [Bacteroidales bacterium]